MSNAATNIIPAPGPAGAHTTEELLVALTRKVDELGVQVGHLYDRTLAMEELKDELVHIARDAMGALQVELGAMEHEFNTEEIVHLLRQLLRSTPRFIRLLERLESLDALTQELEPLSKEMVRDLVERLNTWEERGYFQLAQSLLQVVDRVAAHTSEDDLSWLADHVGPLLETAKQATRPEILNVAQGALTAVSEASREEGAAEVGLWGLAKASREPQVRRGLGLAVEVLRQVGAAAPAPALEGADPSTPRLPEHGERHDS
ncbi:MAG: DUF1641 domain-containing protein [Deltaproteobacteria bacterium]|jgi:uncharacterized protein YjgD (DUF1641 family)|nr:DUF1641 domain-containing protein [Deltaproteobacteria bacterium]MBW2530679.1 DUF1641 domain-containing protein [Deltaproteobacteria bacterium]